LQHPSIGYYSAYQKRELILSVDKTSFTEGAAVFDDAFSRWKQDGALRFSKPQEI
jgi:hypothetical protein